MKKIKKFKRETCKKGGTRPKERGRKVVGRKGRRLYGRQKVRGKNGRKEKGRQEFRFTKKIQIQRERVKGVRIRHRNR